MGHFRSRMLYAKRGGRFVPVGTDNIMAGMYVPGDYLVRVRKGDGSINCIRKGLGLCDARVEVALAVARDAVAMAILRVSNAMPNVERLSKRELRAFKEYKRIAGTESLTFTRKSACDMAGEAVLVLREQLRTKEVPERYLEVMAERTE